MIKYLKAHPEVFSAVIAGVVSLLIAGVSAVYVIWNSAQKIDALRSEVMTTSLAAARTERLLEAHDSYLVAYRDYDSRMRTTSDNSSGFVERLNLITDLYAAHSRDLVDRYGDFLPPNVVNMKSELQSSIDRHSQAPSTQNAQNFHEMGIRFHELLTTALANQ